MKKILPVLIAIIFIQWVSAQKNVYLPFKNNPAKKEIKDTTNYSNTSSYNKWSIELAVGANRPLYPFSPGYSSSEDGKLISNYKIDHYEFGVRYMFNTKFGVKVNGEFDKVTNSEGSSSQEFKTEAKRISFQGVINLSRILNFEVFTSRIGLLFHVGGHLERFTPKIGPNYGLTENVGGIIYGFSPQIKLSNKIIVHLDLTIMNNFRQHYTWDGYSSAFDGKGFVDNSLNGGLITSAIGLTIYLGKHEKHADWFALENYSSEIKKYIPSETPKQDLSGIILRLDELENCLLDSDKDGVNDCIDEEENTPLGATVNTKGVSTQSPKDGRNGTNGFSVYVDPSNNKIQIRKGAFLNIFYSVNKYIPNAVSTRNINSIVDYMMSNPESKIRLIGYADMRGGAEKNKILSEKRAKNLTFLMLSKGISKDRIKYDGFGVDRKSSNMSKEEMDYARRTEVIIE